MAAEEPVEDPVAGLAAGVAVVAGAELSDFVGAAGASDFSLGLRSRLGLDRFESDLESLL